MRTELSPAHAASEEGRAAERILRKCVHCGFCNAACPTYRLLGDELDSPRGRIYLIKQVLEGEPNAAVARRHLDRCLTCRACETSCPSGVEFGELLEIGRATVERAAPRSAPERASRALLVGLLRSPRLLEALARVGRGLALVLPADLRVQLTPRPLPGATVQPWPSRTHPRRIGLLEGCVQPALLPAIDVAAARVFDAVGIQTLRVRGGLCCGALRLHLGQHEQAIADVQRSVDACWEAVEQGAEALTSTASACAGTLKDWGRILKDDPLRAARAKQLAGLARDPVELLEPELPRLRALLVSSRGTTSATMHCPCTLQHGQRLGGRVEALLRGLGWDLRVPTDATLCCGSAGTFSLLQSGLSAELRKQKLAALDACQSEAVVSANVGCILQLQGAQAPVGHWLELLAAALPSGSSNGPAC
jgi:glycolate oxidase iron-sulfur subunit